MRLGPPGDGARAASASAAGRPRPSFSRVVTRCHDEYLRTFRPLRLEGFVLGPAPRLFDGSRCRLESVVLHHAVDGAPWAATASVADGRLAVVFAGAPDAVLHVDGHGLARDAVCAVGPGARATLVARRPGDWYVITLPEARLGEFAVAGVPVPARGAAVFHVPPTDLSRLRAMVVRALSTSEGATPGNPSREVAGAHEIELVAFLKAAIAAGAAGPPRAGASRVARHEVLAKVDRLLDARAGEPVYVADLCAATGLPERTLRYVLVEQYGTSPIRILRNRRLCQVRRVLLAGSPTEESLSHLAGRHGFWHMGTFAADYRKLFGELPSETRRAALEAAERPPASQEGPFVRPAKKSGSGAPVAVAEAVAGR